MADLDLNRIRDVMVSVAYDAGVVILNSNPASIGTDTKLNCNTNPVTSLPKPPFLALIFMCSFIHSFISSF